MISLFGYQSHSIDLAYPYRFRYAILSFVLLIAASLLIFCSLLNVRQTSLFMLGLCLWVLALSGLRLSVLAFRYGRQLQRQQAAAVLEQQQQHRRRHHPDIDDASVSSSALQYWLQTARSLTPLPSGPGGAPPAFSDINVYEYSVAVEPPNPYRAWHLPPPSYSDVDVNSIAQPPPKYEDIVDEDQQQRDDDADQNGNVVNEESALRQQDNSESEQSHTNESECPEQQDASPTSNPTPQVHNTPHRHSSSS